MSFWQVLPHFHRLVIDLSVFGSVQVLVELPFEMVFTLYSFLVRSNTWSVSVIAYHNTPYLFLIDSHSYIDSLFITSFRLYQFSHLPHFWRGSIFELFLVRTQFWFALVFNQISFSSRAQHPPPFFTSLLFQECYHFSISRFQYGLVFAPSQYIRRQWVCTHFGY